MSRQNAVHIPKDVLVQVGKDLGMEVNRLASYFGLEEATKKVEIDPTWMDVLPVILQPLNFAGVKVLFEDDSLLYTNVLSDEKDAAYVGNEAEDLVAVLMSPDVIMHELAAYLGEVEETPRVKQELSLEALVALLAIGDTVKRIKLRNILDPNLTVFDLDLQTVSDEFMLTVNANDLRWMGPFMQDLRYEAKKIDFNKALNELSKLGIIQYKDKQIEIDDKGAILFEELLSRKTMLGIRSVFYHEGVLNYLSLAFIRTQNYIWYLDGAEKSSIMNLSSLELEGFIATMLAPGEVPQALEMKHVEEEVVEVKKEASGPRFCRNCGEKLSPGAKFCKSCGTMLT